MSKEKNNLGYQKKTSEEVNEIVQRLNTPRKAEKSPKLERRKKVKFSQAG